MPSLRTCKGLHTYKNELNLPEGALNVADNVVIDEDDVIEPRRGFSSYGSEIPEDSILKQLIVYKDTIIRHYDNKLEYDSENNGLFSSFFGNYSEVKENVRIKYIEANSNLYFTTSNGIKKIDATNKSDFSSATGVIKNAGAPKATSLEVSLNYEAGGFLSPNSKCAYRILWGYKDKNNNLILGYPSNRFVSENTSNIQEIKEVSSIKIDAYTTIVGSQYFLFDSTDQKFFGWFNKSGTNTEPQTEETLGRIPVEIKINGLASNNDVAVRVASSLGQVEGFTTSVFGNEVFLECLQAGEVPNISGTVTGVSLSVVVNGEIRDGSSANTTLKFSVPIEIDSKDFFYQIYRTAVFQVPQGLLLSDIDPGDEMNLVYEANLTDSELANMEVTTTDITPESFRVTGAYLYTNPVSGEGILQGNDKPPIALDIESYKGYTFFANTKTVHKKTINLVSVAKLISGDSKIAIGTNANYRTYTFVGEAEQSEITCDTYANTVSSSYIIINSALNMRKYYLWFYKDSGSSDPDIEDRIGLKVNISNVTSANDIAELIAQELLFTDDFEVETVDNVLTITCLENGKTDEIAMGTVAPGGLWNVERLHEGIGEDITTNSVLLSNSTSAAQAIDRTANSLINVINKDSLSTVNAYYLSTQDTLPGIILLESKLLTDVKFYMNVNDSDISSMFNPSIPATPFIQDSNVFSDNELSPNRIMYSKLNQPEAVPIINYIDIGPKDKAIQRIMALRDTLFILKEDGIYTLTGSSADNFSVRLLDSSTQILAGDTASILNNNIYTLSSQGVVSLSDSGGVNIISRNIENVILGIRSPRYNYRQASFGISSESDRSYLLFLPSETTDEVATQCFRYNSFTRTWVRWTISANCAVVNPLDDKIYLGSSIEPVIKKERKNKDRTDYADDEFVRFILADSVDGNIINLNSTSGIEKGDIILQKQYLTFSTYNRLLQKLDIDTGLDDSDYHTLRAEAGDDLTNKLIDLNNKLIADDSSGTITFKSFSIDFPSMQSEFNLIIQELNNVNCDTVFKNYKESTGTVEEEMLILSKDDIRNKLSIVVEIPFMVGPVSIYKGIKSIAQYAPQHFGEPASLKQVREGTVLIDQDNFYSATVSYHTDISTFFEDIDFNASTTGVWGNFNWGEIRWGGDGGDVPLRTLIPRNKQRCRFMIIKFTHINARESFRLVGISLEARQVSSKGYR